MEIKKPDNISRGFIYACMGFGDKEPDKGSRELIAKCEKLVLEASAPAVIYKKFELLRIDDSDINDEYLCIGNKNFPLKGTAIEQHLTGCESCVLMAVTLGVQVDKLIRKTQLTNMAEAVTMDACASSLTEDICDDINGILEEEFAQQRMGLTPRFSPGYGDLPLETQNVFEMLLDMNKKIGLTQSKEHLLIPRKSVTAIIGILPLMELDKRNNKDKEMKAASGRERSNGACEVCERKVSCSFRKNGGFCGRIRT